MWISKINQDFTELIFLQDQSYYISSEKKPQKDNKNHPEFKDWRKNEEYFTTV